jgi:hypothetical protein
VMDAVRKNARLPPIWTAFERKLLCSWPLIIGILAVPLRPGAPGTGGMFRERWCRLRALLVVSASTAAMARANPSARHHGPRLENAISSSGAARWVWPGHGAVLAEDLAGGKLPH